MQNYDRIIELLGQKRTLFIDFERVTEEMLSCETDALERNIAERERLVRAIDTIQFKLDRLIADSGDEQVEQAVKNSCDFAALPEAMRPVYQAAAAIRAVLSRLTETETQVALRLRMEQQRILEQIKSTNRSVSAQASRFFSGPNGGANTGTHLGDA